MRQIERAPIRFAYSRQRRGAIGLLITLLALLWAGSGLAAHRVERLAQELRASKDFRVRTQAALALGASGQQGAVVPLCAGLRDENRTVRAASAAALGKLGLGGVGCVKQALKREKQANVRRVLTKVLRRLQGSTRREIGPTTKYYVAIGPTTNKSPGADATIDEMVRSALERELAREQTLAVAPPDESQAQAEALLKKHASVSPIFIWPKLSADNKGSTLKFKLSFTLFTYPDKAFKGSMAQKLSMQGAQCSDISALRELIEAAAPRIVSKFLSHVEQFK